MKTNNFAYLLVLIFFIFQSNTSIAQNIDTLKTYELKPVIFSATKTKRQLSSIPLPTTIIKKNEIELSGSSRLSEILIENTGLITVPNFIGGEGIQMQGIDSDYILIMIDGSPLIGRSSGTLDLNRISVGNIKQIEIVKGASSSLYGSEALGGIINIITNKNLKNGFSKEFSYRYGSFNTHDGIINLEYRKNKFSVSGFINAINSIGYDLIKSDRLKTVNPYNNLTNSIKIHYKLSNKSRVETSFRIYNQNQEKTSLVLNEVLYGNSKIDEWNIKVKYTNQISDNLEANFEFYNSRYKTNEYLNQTTGGLYSSVFFNQYFLRPELQIKYKIDNVNNLIIGIGNTFEKLNRTEFSSTHKYHSQFLYMQYDWNPSNLTNIIVGNRFDRHNVYNSQISPKAAIFQKINDKLILKSSIGYGFKAPDFRQLYLDFTNSSVGYSVLGYNIAEEKINQMESNGELNNKYDIDYSKKLRAENSISYNVGIQYFIIPSTPININFFRNAIKDLIETRIIARKVSGQNIFSYYNVNNAYTQGVEIKAEHGFSNGINISGGYQLLYAKDSDVESKFKNGEVYGMDKKTLQSYQLDETDYYGLYNKSRHMSNVRINYNYNKWKTQSSLRILYRGKFGNSDTNNNAYLDDYDVFISDYLLINLSLLKEIYNHYKIQLGIDNVFNYKDVENISNLPGRKLYIKLKINF